jgi:2-(1,2-epoxy-1,2-dihydrophenyl)acetyl-CoA isomerase
MTEQAHGEQPRSEHPGAGQLPGEHDTAAASPELTVALSDDHVATLEINRPPSNYFSLGLLAQIADACDELAAGGDCRAVVLCSAGRIFCAGADFAAGPQLSGQGGLHLYDVAQRLFEQPLPVVAAVQGAAIGGGLGLAMAADFRVASPHARFAANFALLGIHQGFALSVTLPAAVGQQAALDLLYTGRRVTGTEALALGLADELAEADQVRDRAHARAARIAAAAPLAVRSIRQTLRGPLAVQARAAMARERAEQERLMQTTDWREGLAAVRDRRPAEFTGQ